MFGPDDYFLTTLATLLRTLPIYPLFGRGRTRLQPVYVEDVSEAIARILGCAAGSGYPCYELRGPRTYTFAELVRSVADGIGTHPWLVPLPFVLWEAVALLSEFTPGALLTRNQVALMRRDNVASDLYYDAQADSAHAVLARTAARRRRDDEEAISATPNVPAIASLPMHKILEDETDIRWVSA
jgi:uncharacterized protein YbjT (DUF2867 family)